MKTTLVLRETQFSEILEAVNLSDESAAVVLAKPITTSAGNMRLLVQQIHWVTDEDYEVRDPYRLCIASTGYVSALGEAQKIGAIAIWMHTHPGKKASPTASSYDNVVDKELADVFRLRTGSEYYGSLIFAPDGTGFSFTGHLESETEEFSIDHVWKVGNRLALISNQESTDESLPAIFDRNILAFGGEIQRVLGQLRVGVVGCGGTGSSVVEQLVRIGVRDFILIDPDYLSDSNISRVYGSGPSDLGSAKVEIAANMIKKIAPESQVMSIQSSINVEDTARALSDRDLIFGCTDDNSGRLVLSRLSSYLLIPVIDCGVLISNSDNGKIKSIDGRITFLSPGTACLVCRDRIDLKRAASETMTPAERVRLENEGYIPAVANAEPAVVAFTTQVAAAAVSELCERLTGFGPEPPPSEILLRIHDREISRNIASPKDHHYCDPEHGRIGIGMTEPFLDQVWNA